MTDDSVPADGRATREWPVDLRGVTETVVATLGPNELWNLAALGVHAPGFGSDDSDSSASSDESADENTATADKSVTADKSATADESVTADESTTADGSTTADESATADEDHSDTVATARTWGRTRTWRNFRERGEGVIQFVTDPRTFVDAAMTVREERTPVVPSADAWVRVAVERRASGESGGTKWVDWTLRPVEAAVRREEVRTIDRGFGAVIDATVAASRLDVPTYDTDELLDRLQYFERVVDRAGGPREREAFAAIDDAVGWRDRLDD